ncbi:MAG: TetR/AcrR family transcriptional regulator [Proteobacteria bacterium]|nr:TetR/AcrR family transcriptional regulator [Pseudomonadota bacterium]
MDNASRSERTRNAALEAALTVVARDGPARLTLDAIAKEAGISKGGLMHQFPTKHAVLKALLERQRAYFKGFAEQYIAKLDRSVTQPNLSAQIATLREASVRRSPAMLAIVGAMTEEPDLLAVNHESDLVNTEAIKAESDDPQLALLRKAAAQGLALTAIFRMSTLSEKERIELFDRLLDDKQWVGFANPAGLLKPPGKRKSPAKTRRR